MSCKVTDLRPMLLYTSAANCGTLRGEAVDNRNYHFAFAQMGAGTDISSLQMRLQDDQRTIKCTAYRDLSMNQAESFIYPDWQRRPDAGSITEVLQTEIDSKIDETTGRIPVEAEITINGMAKLSTVGLQHPWSLGLEFLNRTECPVSQSTKQR
jgi:hypothetical protein